MSAPQGWGPAAVLPGRAFMGVGFLFDQVRAQELVESTLQRGTVIVAPVDLAGQLDEVWAEVPVPLAQPDLILDVPEPLVDRFQLAGQLVQLGGGPDRTGIGGLDDGKLGPHVAELLRIADPLRLDLED